MLHALDVRGLKIPNNVFLAPMAGYTNLPFRSMCERLGAGLTFTEMVSAKGLHYANAETGSLLLHAFPSEDEEVSSVEESSEEINTPLAAQLFGSDPALLREACESEALRDFDIIDLNMGCPMPKIVRNGEGSALLENLPLAEKIVSECVKSGKRISVKFRIGIREGETHAAEYAKAFEGAGACMLTVHGRTREKIYTGPPDFSEIAAVKNAVQIPVIANGGIWSRTDAEKMIERTGADGVMIARAALYNPRVFCSIAEREKPPLLPLFLRQLDETKKLYGERFALVYMRKMAAFYLKGARGAAKGKQRLFAATSTDEVRSLAEELMKEE